jgi:GNAT superfamily N-acetyltransferase/ribosomal protein S18 acetylase RimI-like enzyme
MLTVRKIDVRNKADVNQFVSFHYSLYQGCPQWVPPFYIDVKTQLNPDKHPFYEHSIADFFLAEQDGKVVGRIGALENRPFNRVHETKDAEFYLFDSIDNQEVANALFTRCFEWARERGLNHVVGPKGFHPFDGYGIQVEGNDLRQMMNMMTYNYPYYSRLVESIGFTKEVDFVSCYIKASLFKFPEKMDKAVEIVKKRGSFEVKTFTSKNELRQWAKRIGEAYNKTFVKNWEYYPLTQREIDFVLETLLMVAVPKLIKIITRKEEVVGFLLAFPDISPAMQRAKGHLNPISIVDMMLEFKKTKFVSLNGAGVLPEYQGLGGNVIMYDEMEKTVMGSGFEDIELTQVAETAVQMRKDLITSGGKAYKNHRVYQIRL